MKVKVRYYGRFVTLLNKFEDTIEVSEGYTVKDLVEFLKKKYPQLKNEYIEVSIDGKYAHEEATVDAGEIAVYPVISGG